MNGGPRAAVTAWTWANSKRGEKEIPRDLKSSRVKKERIGVSCEKKGDKRKLSKAGGVGWWLQAPSIRGRISNRGLHSR